VFIKRNVSRRGDKAYTTVLLVEGERVPLPRPPGRPRKGEEPKTKVVHKTLANLSKLPVELQALIESFCQAQRRGESLELSSQTQEPVIGRAYGPLAALLALAREAGMERALGTSRLARLAMFLVLARVIHQGSRLSAVRWAETQAVAETLGLGTFDENDLYAALDWLEENQARIERALAPRNAPGAFFLYDVTSSYLEGQQNELAAPGYNRDGKRFKKQIVMGLLTDVEGEPVSIQVYPGNTADPTTVGSQVDKLAKEFEASEVILVGDRGMLKTQGRQLLSEQGYRFVTALTDPQVRKLLSQGTLQLDLFNEKVSEVVAPDGVRYVLRRNPATQQRHRSRRADQLQRVREKLKKRNAMLEASARANREASLRQVQRWLKTYKLTSFVTARLEGRSVVLEVDEERQREEELLDGCYVIISDVPSDKVTAQQLWDRYGDLQRVERDFRTLKTGMLEIRPLFLRKANRTRAHALVSMLALKLVRALRRRVQPLGLTEQDALDRLEGVRLVTLADPKLGLWHLPSRWDKPQREVLAVLPPLPPPMLSLRSERLNQ
jgi:hypothetical protein